jgi:hypothetical protein
MGVYHSRNIMHLPAGLDNRIGRNMQYRIADADLGAFSMFDMRSPSFLARL